MAYSERLKYWCGVQVWKYLNLILMKLTRGADPNSIHFRMVYHLYIYREHSEFVESSRSAIEDAGME